MSRTVDASCMKSPYSPVASISGAGFPASPEMVTETNTFTEAAWW
jgi:hypothetical protein